MKANDSFLKWRIVRDATRKENWGVENERRAGRFTDVRKVLVSATKQRRKECQPKIETNAMDGVRFGSGVRAATVRQFGDFLLANLLQYKRSWRFRLKAWFAN